MRMFNAQSKTDRKQGRNFGLKSGGTNSEGERGALEEAFPPHPTLGSGRTS